MGCGTTFVKYSMFISNLLFALAGLALIILGVVTKLQLKAIDDISHGNYQVASYVAIGIGSIIFIIAFFGCCGAISENNCMLVTYSSFMLILMAIQVTLAILLIVKRDTILAELTAAITTTFNKDRNAFTEFESAFKCCGPFGGDSYPIGSYSNTCCASPPCNDPGSLFSGCNEVVRNFVMKYNVPIAVSTLVIAALELVAAIFGLCLSSHVKENLKGY